MNAIDLGLPSGTKWADSNVGATKPEECGMYFAWGATEGADSNTSDGKLFYWDTSPYPQDGDVPTVLDTEHDAATVNMGAPWRMPTKADFDELVANTTSMWITFNGIYGRWVTSKINGAKLFFPASGYRHGTSIYETSYEGCYWSASLDTLERRGACMLEFDSDFVEVNNNGRCLGFPIRAIC